MSEQTYAAVVADTHILLWAIFTPTLLSAEALSALNNVETNGEPIYISAISLVELRYLIEKGKFIEEDYRTVIQAINGKNNSLTLVSLDQSVAAQMTRIPRSQVPDMPDRIIAATALHLGIPLITRDGKIRVKRNKNNLVKRLILTGVASLN